METDRSSVGECHYPADLLKIIFFLNMLWMSVKESQVWRFLKLCGTNHKSPHKVIFGLFILLTKFWIGGSKALV